MFVALGVVIGELSCVNVSASRVAEEMQVSNRGMRT